ncbi:MAG: hypothetical protein ACR2L2_11900 [Acidobacteriota bacterium]
MHVSELTVTVLRTCVAGIRHTAYGCGYAALCLYGEASKICPVFP